MTDTHGSTNGAHGGVGHLLRMAKTQCGVSLAFAALRKADGGFAIATFPTVADDPTWSVEAIDELVRQTWEDPHLSGGSVLVRSGRVLSGMWTGQGHHMKLAAAALSDPGSPEHPWGLLCVAEPLTGHFEQEQLNLLGNLAVRLTSYLRARQQVLEGAQMFEPADTRTAPPETVATGYEPMVQTPLVPETSAAPPPVTPPFEKQLEEPEAEQPLHQAGDTYEPVGGSWDAPPPTASRRVDDWEFLGLEEIDWVEAVAPAPPMNAPVEPVPEGASTFGTREAEIPPTAAVDDRGGLDALLGPDPATGLATLTTLIGRLSTSLAHVLNNEGTVGLILVDVTAVNRQPLSTTALMTVAGRLTNHLRERDVVARIGTSLFAVMVDLRPGAVELDAIRQRALGTLTAGIETSTGGLQARTAMASAGTGSSISAEELLRDAAERLGRQ